MNKEEGIKLNNAFDEILENFIKSAPTSAQVS